MDDVFSEPGPSGLVYRSTLHVPGASQPRSGPRSSQKPRCGALGMPEKPGGGSSGDTAQGARRRAGAPGYPLSADRPAKSFEPSAGANRLERRRGRRARARLGTSHRGTLLARARAMGARMSDALICRRAPSAAWLGLVVSLACGSPPPPVKAPSADDDRKAVLAQELGEAPAPEGPCPDRNVPNVLGDPRVPVQRTALGLAYCILQEGPPGTVPGASDTVRVHYTGWTVDGEMFDSSVERGEPLELPLDGVIRGWTEGLRLMTPGDKARLWIPGNLGYGRREPGEPAGAPPKGTLIFDIELIEVARAPAEEEQQGPSEPAKVSEERQLNPRLPAPKEEPKRRPASSSMRPRVQ